jgi:hypothetical protein
MTERVEQQYCIKFCQKLGDSKAETVRKIQQAFGHDAMGAKQIKEWFNHFKDGRTLAESDQRSGTPSTSQNANVIENVRKSLKFNEIKIVIAIWTAPLLRRLVTGFPLRQPGFKPRSGHVGFCDGQKWRWGRFSPRTSVSLANLHFICFSTIIFTFTQGWHNRPGVAAVPIASQTK